jgi:exopolyphosphatase/guanosine-5'-triphosphate,3'-diphosphate pyrophosphatase
MHVAQGALRQGALYDLLDREQPETDLRTATVQGLIQSFAVDPSHAERVAGTACSLFIQLSATHPESVLRKLKWAGRLHEIGCRISHSDYHRHGAYILENTDAAGFAKHELHRLGSLVLGHKGKVRKLQADLEDTTFALQLMSLRLAVALCHARREPDLDGFAVSIKGQRFHIAARPGWASTYPQSAHLLREETLAWLRTPWELEVHLP